MVVSARTTLVVGLGNPGQEYGGTRHNAGFEVLDRVAQRHGSSFKRKWRMSAVVAELVVADAKVTLAKPGTFMNRSGQAVAALVNWLKASPASLLVVVDDADLPVGQMRLRQAGGSGGHNGLRSIIAALGGDENFPRLRVGIGRTAPVGADIANHVLGRFAPAERVAAAAALDVAADAVECCLKEGLTTAMNRFNRKTPPQAGQEGDGD
jgi:PTH1 family peptidyl-tRNA hydrolase